jgi:hypothetical protein
MIGIPCHSEAFGGASVSGRGVLVGVGAAGSVGTAIKVDVGTGVEVGWTAPEQAVVIVKINANNQVKIVFFTRLFLIPMSK